MTKVGQKECLKEWKEHSSLRFGAETNFRTDGFKVCFIVHCVAVVRLCGDAVNESSIFHDWSIGSISVEKLV